jgi:hypothetical protein
MRSNRLYVLESISSDAVCVKWGRIYLATEAIPAMVWVIGRVLHRSLSVRCGNLLKRRSTDMNSSRRCGLETGAPVPS